MRHDYKEQNLRRRIRCEECHIQYLNQLAIDPGTNDHEIQRRVNCITALKESIVLHEAAILKLQTDAAHVSGLLKAAELKLKGFRREQNKHLVEKWLAEYILIHSTLKDGEECSS